MSTRLTQNNIPMVESRSLRLAFASRRLHEGILQRVAAHLIEMGYEAATPAALDFLGALECGDNHASEIARMMGVSRQWVAKNVRAFCRLGYLEQVTLLEEDRISAYYAAGLLYATSDRAEPWI